MYLHEPGEDLDSYTREDMSTIQHAAKAAEGMHANALAAHHMRRQPSRADSSSTTNQEDGASVALPPTVSWASTSKANEASEAGDNTQVETLPPSRALNEPQLDIPPPPSQAAHNSVLPSDLLPPPVLPGQDHPILGNMLKSFYETKFNFTIVPRVMPGLTEADVKAAESFPQLFAWNPVIKRPSSPGKNGKNHARSGSRYAFADTRTPPPGFVPPGLATGLRPPGFQPNAQGSSKESSTDFFSQFLRNAGFNENGPNQTSSEDPANINSKDSAKPPVESNVTRPGTNGMSHQNRRH